MAFRIRNLIGRTLYVLESEAALDVRSGQLVIQTPGDTHRVPTKLIDHVVCLNFATLSSRVVADMCKHGRAISLMSHKGRRFVGFIRGVDAGNVLLRQRQYRAHDQTEAALDIAKHIVAAKFRSSRNWIRRVGRSTSFSGDESLLNTGATMQSAMLRRISEVSTLDELRGAEGQAAKAHFSCLGERLGDLRLGFTKRIRRPPRDPVNAMLSFGYTLLAADCAAAVQSVGLDPAIGFLHGVRPGRLSLALDLMEEFRLAMVDRLVVRLLARRQISGADFSTDEPSGSMLLNSGARKLFVAEYARQKKSELHHPYFDRTVPLFLVMQLQANLIGRHLRGDLKHYPAWVLR